MRWVHPEWASRSHRITHTAQHSMGARPSFSPCGIVRRVAGCIAPPSNFPGNGPRQTVVMTAEMSDEATAGSCPFASYPAPKLPGRHWSTPEFSRARGVAHMGGRRRRDREFTPPYPRTGSHDTAEGGRSNWTDGKAKKLIGFWLKARGFVYPQPLGAPTRRAHGLRRLLEGGKGIQAKASCPPAEGQIWVGAAAPSLSSHTLRAPRSHKHTQDTHPRCRTPFPTRIGN